VQSKTQTVETEIHIWSVDSHGGEYSAPPGPDPLDWFKGSYFRGRKRKGRELKGERLCSSRNSLCPGGEEPALPKKSFRRP